MILDLLSLEPQRNVTLLCLPMSVNISLRLVIGVREMLIIRQALAKAVFVKVDHFVESFSTMHSLSDE
jgi:hypothetical protein